MDSWLAAANDLVESKTPFVLATLWSKSGNSPDDPGSRLVVTKDNDFGDFVSEQRRQMITDTARALLQSGANSHVERYPLGNILGTANGYLEVVFDCIHPDQKPALSEARQLQLTGETFIFAQHICRKQRTIKSVRYQLFTGIEVGKDSIALPAHGRLKKKLPTITTELLVNQSQETLLRIIRQPVINVGILGAGKVAVSLVEQLKLLPTTIQWFASDFVEHHENQLSRAPLNNRLFETLPYRTRLVIASGDHDSDLHFSHLALQSDRVSYVGCIGSAKKARLIKGRLKKLKLSTHDLKRLHIPVGIPEIVGKHPSIIAASIVAQLLAFREN